MGPATPSDAVRATRSVNGFGWWSELCAPVSCPVFFYSSQSSAAGPGGNAHAGEDVGLVGPDRAGGQTHGAGVGAGLGWIRMSIRMSDF